MAHDIERKLAAILSADVVGYSRLMADDESATIRTLADYREEIVVLIRQHRGRVVDTAGDSLLAEFPTATDAVSCAVEAQGVLKVRNAAVLQDRKMEFRVGVHLGEVRVEGDRIYGDGVNIAARLEALAEAGGVCISGEVHGQVRNKLDVAFEDMGEQSLKNIPAPIRIYRVQPRSQPGEPTHPASPPPRARGVLAKMALATAVVLLLLGVALWATWPRPLGLLIDVAGIGGLPAEPALPEKPSIVVLPFENLSGDPEQEYFSDGITEDLTHELARYPFVFVIARNSAFTYKGKHVNVEDVGRELGVRYVVEGSVRKAEGRVRIAARLIDATTGGHLWSERFDRDLSDIFALQAEIAAGILAAVGGKILRVEEHRLARRPATSLSAYEAYLKGVLHSLRCTVPDYEAASGLYARALELDPDFAPAHAALGVAYVSEYAYGWNRDPALLDRAEALGRRAITLDPTHFQGYMAVGWAELNRGNLSEALAVSERAIELAPNFEMPHALRALALARQGRLVEATGSVRRALRLSPRAPIASVLVAVSYVNFRAGRRQEGMEFLEQARAGAPDHLPVRGALAFWYEGEGAHDKARAEVAEILRVRPDLTAERAMELIPGLEQILSPEELAQVPERLRLAGLP